MRFTTWPALKSAFLIFTATLPSLILADNPNIIDNPAHNGQVPGVEISFLTPLSGSNYYPGENSVISWYVKNGGLETEQEFMMSWVLQVHIRKPHRS
jgi:hypothetical protein